MWMIRVFEWNIVWENYKKYFSLFIFYVYVFEFGSKLIDLFYNLRVFNGNESIEVIDNFCEERILSNSFSNVKK